MRKRTWGFVVGGLLVALLLAGVVSNYASTHPDGLDASLRKGCTVDANGRITGGSCPAQRTRQHELAGGPLAGYGIRGLDNRFLSTGLSGVAGVLLTFALGGGLFWLTRRRGPATPAPATPAPAAVGPASAAPATADPAAGGPIGGDPAKLGGEADERSPRGAGAH